MNLDILAKPIRTLMALLFTGSLAISLQAQNNVPSDQPTTASSSATDGSTSAEGTYRISTPIERSRRFGHDDGVSFDDSSYNEKWGPITKIVVRSDSEVRYIGVAYANGTYMEHGGTSGIETNIDLDVDDYIVRVSGRSGSRLDQIMFWSHKGKAYGPYGGNGGASFDCPFQNRALLYFFGRSTDTMNQIGFGSSTPPEKLPITIWRSNRRGGLGGNLFDDLSSVGVLGKIESITIRYDSVIEKITVKYKDGPECSHGGDGGIAADPFILQDDEWITEIRGRSGRLLDQLQFFTSKGRVSPVYGGNGGGSFTWKKDNCVIKSFFGRSCTAVDSLGVYFEDDRMERVEILDMHFDVNHLPPSNPKVMTTISLENNTEADQNVTKGWTLETTDTSTTTITETNEYSVNLTVKTTFQIFGGGVDTTLSTGYKSGATYATGSTHTEKITDTYTVTTRVPAHSKIYGQVIYSEAEYNIPWTATANVYYMGKSNPVQMELHGTLYGVKQGNLRVKWEDGSISTFY